MPGLADVLLMPMCPRAMWQSRRTLSPLSSCWQQGDLRGISHITINYETQCSPTVERTGAKVLPSPFPFLGGGGWKSCGVNWKLHGHCLWPRCLLGIRLVSFHILIHSPCPLVLLRFLWANEAGVAREAPSAQGNAQVWFLAMKWNHNVQPAWSPGRGDRGAVLIGSWSPNQRPHALGLLKVCVQLGLRIHNQFVLLSCPRSKGEKWYK